MIDLPQRLGLHTHLWCLRDVPGLALFGYQLLRRWQSKNIQVATWESFQWEWPGDVLGTSSGPGKNQQRGTLAAGSTARNTSGNTGSACRFAAVWNGSKISLIIFTYLNMEVNQLCWSLPPASHLPSQNTAVPQQLWQHPRKTLEFLLAEFTAERGSSQLRWALSPLEAFCCCCFKRKLHILGRLWSYYQTMTTGRHESITVGFKDKGSVDLLKSIKELWLSET